jgi:cysteine desulfurase
MSHAKELFLDHAATTPVHPDAVGLMLPFFGNHFGIPSSPSELGQRPRRALEEARSRAAALINASPAQVVFTSGGTEANNLAVLGAASAGRKKGNHIVTTAVEHASVLNACRHLETRGFRMSILPVDDQGRVDPEQVREALCDDTILISVSHASNETGTIQPVEEIGAMARERGIIFHCDAVQSTGKVSLDVRTLPVDLLSISSHKLYGPKGAGALFVADRDAIEPVIFGSGQEHGIRPGTINVPCVAGFGLACSVAQRDLENNGVLMTSLRESLEQQTVNRIAGVKVNGADAPRLPHISSLSFRGVPADDLAAYLDAVHIVVSSRCSPGIEGHEMPPALAALGLEKEYASGTIRLSLGWENKEKQIRRAVKSLADAVESLRGFAAASRDKDVTMFTFPDRENAAAALKSLSGAGPAFSLAARPRDLAHGSCSSIALACLSKDQTKVGALLGESGVTIAGLHKTRDDDRPMKKKEREFWDKVERIKKGLPS